MPGETVDVAASTKRCSSCQQTKALADFGRNRSNRSADGLQYYCKPCSTTAVRLYQQSPKGLARRRAYNQSAAGRAAQARYNDSPGGRMARARYARSAKGKASRLRAKERRSLRASTGDVQPDVSGTE